MFPLPSIFGFSGQFNLRYWAIEFSGTVSPGERVTTVGRKTFFRRLKLRSEVEMKLDDGTVVCSGVLSGIGIPR